MPHRSPRRTCVALPAAPSGLEAACAHLGDVLANGGPAADLEDAARQLARAARSVGLPERALVTWLIVAGAVACGGMATSAGLARQLNAWAADEFAAGAVAAGRPDAA